MGIYNVHRHRIRFNCTFCTLSLSFSCVISIRHSSLFYLHFSIHSLALSLSKTRYIRFVSNAKSGRRCTRENEQIPIVCQFKKIFSHNDHFNQFVHNIYIAIVIMLKIILIQTNKPTILSRPSTIT